MALTRDFKNTIRNRAQKDSDFRKALLIEAVNALLADEIDVAKSLLKDYINASILFEPLAKKVNKNSKSLQRMFSARGNPTAQSLFSVIRELQEAEGIKLTVSVHGVCDFFKSNKKTDVVANEVKQER
jgi:DNA-binding phage protein